MDNRYLFRGKRIDSGEWVMGYYYRNTDNRCFIYVPYLRTFDTYEVAPATISQCTGLSAAKSYRGNQPNDLLVFEGDVILDEQLEITGVVAWGATDLAWMVVVDEGCKYLEEFAGPSDQVAEDISIMGTIHEFVNREPTQ